MNSPASSISLGMAFGWGDRNRLIPKRMQYVLSLELVARATALHLLIDQREKALRHVFGQSVTTLPDGTRSDLPEATIIGGEGRIGDHLDPSSSALSLRITAKMGPSQAPLLITCQGVVNFVGGTPGHYLLGPNRVSGMAFVATRQETSSPTYRWLNRRQLFGVGRVLRERFPDRKEERPANDSVPNATIDAPDRMAFTFDLYAAA